LEVTSDQGVFVFEPEPGKEKLKANTVVDDGVNGRVGFKKVCFLTFCKSLFYFPIYVN